VKDDAREFLGLGDEAYAAARFCLRCGTALLRSLRFGRQRPVCSGCGFVLFRSPATGAAAVVVRGREVLLVQRGIEPYRGHWGFPAGYQDYGESAAEAAVRETREETGLEIRIERILDVLYTRDDPRKQANLIVFLARAVAGDLRAADDADDARFFPLDACPEDIAFDNNRLLLERLRRDLPKGDFR